MFMVKLENDGRYVIAGRRYQFTKSKAEFIVQCLLKKGIQSQVVGA